MRTEKVFIEEAVVARLAIECILLAQVFHQYHSKVYSQVYFAEISDFSVEW